MNNFIRRFLLCAVFATLQVLLFDRLSLGTMVYPCPYIICLLLFPFSYNTVLLMLWGFALGLGIDLMGTGIVGIHASAALVLALFRNNLLSMVATKEEIDSLGFPGFATLGFSRYLVFVALCILVHHGTLFILESLSPFHVGQILLRTACSGAANLVLVLVISSFFTRGRKR